MAPEAVFYDLVNHSSCSDEETLSLVSQKNLKDDF